MIKCSQCGEMQPPPPTQAAPTCCPNYYGLLVPDATNRPPRFRLDLKALKAEYLKLQALVHPDKMQGSTGASWSSWINRANDTLKNPLQRAIYLVNLYEGSVTDKGKDKGKDMDMDIDCSSDSDNHVMSDECESDYHDISLVLEVREAIAETASSSSPSALAVLKQQNDARIEDCCRELEGFLDGPGVGVGGRNNFEGAKRCINRLRYWMSIDDELKKRM